MQLSARALRGAAKPLARPLPLLPAPHTPHPAPGWQQSKSAGDIAQRTGFHPSTPLSRHTHLLHTRTAYARTLSSAGFGLAPSESLCDYLFKYFFNTHDLHIRVKVML